MLSKGKLSLAAVVLTLGFGFAACHHGDQNKPEEPVAATQPAEPATPPAQPQTPPAAQNFTAEPVYFGFDEYTLTPQAQEKLNKLADYLKANPKAVVQIEGNTDERGSVEYNLALGERRAQAVKTYLTQLGIDANRLTTISYGEEKPAVEGHNEEAWAKNRRAEFVVSNA